MLTVLKFTLALFLYSPTTGEVLPVSGGDYDTPAECQAAFEAMQQKLGDRPEAAFVNGICVQNVYTIPSA